MNFRIYKDFPTEVLSGNFKQLRSGFVSTLFSFLETFSTKSFQGSVWEQLIEYDYFSQVPEWDSDTSENLSFLLGEKEHLGPYLLKLPNQAILQCHFCPKT